MSIKKIKVFFESGETEEIEITRIFTCGAINDYALKHSKWKYFQFNSQKPEYYRYYDDEYVANVLFEGYLIGKKIKGKKRGDVLECNIKIIR